MADDKNKYEPILSGGTTNPVPSLSEQLGGQFPIIGWHTFSDRDQVTQQNYQNFKDCGFNIAFMPARFFSDPEMNELQSKPLIEALRLCNLLGIKVQVNIEYPNIESAENPEMRYPPYLLNYAEDAINKLKNDPAVIGWYLKDVITARQFGLVWEIESRINAKVKSNQYLYTNLTNMGATDSWFAPSYECYVGSYKDCLKPQMLSFVHYGILENDEGQLKLATNYFNNLQYISDKSRELGIPMWTFILSTAHYKWTKVQVTEDTEKLVKQPNYPVPTLGQLCFQAFCGLAYGSQCIQYFFYGYRNTEPADGVPVVGEWVYHDSPIDKNGKTTDVWKAMKLTNAKIQQVASAFIGMELKQILHIEEAKNANNSSGDIGSITEKLPFPFTKIRCGEAGVLVSSFSNNGKNYLLVVNKDFQNTQDVEVQYSNQKVDCEYKGGEIIDNNPTVQYTGTKIKLNPGDAILFSVIIKDTQISPIG